MIEKLKLFLILLLLHSAFLLGAQEKDITQVLCPKPPLGWNSFDSYGVYLHHDAAMANLKAMAEKLKPFGYEYFVIDGGWYGEFKLVDGTIFPAERHASALNLDDFGIYQPSKTYFPQGLKPIVAYAHQLGLKIGVHLMRGIPRQAVDRNLPIKNSRYRAAEVANKNSICTWNSQNYGVDTSMPGAQDWYNSVIAQIAEWDLDFVKYDDLTPYPDEIIAVAKAIEKCGRKIVLSLSPGGADRLTDLPYYKKAAMLRVSGDIWDRQEDIDKGFEVWKQWQGVAHEGFWIDLDMVPFGNLQMMSPAKYEKGKSNVQLAGLGNTRKSNFSPEQMRTFITMRSLAASPLFVGGDLPTMDSYSLQLLTNKEMLACNQNGECAFNVYQKDGIEIWMCKKKDNPKEGWLGIFNRNKVSVSVDLSKEDLGLVGFTNGYRLRPVESLVELIDIWNNSHQVIVDKLQVLNLMANDVLFLKFSDKWEKER